MNTGDARTEILRSIRAHLAKSAPYDALTTSTPHQLPNLNPDALTTSTSHQLPNLNPDARIPWSPQSPSQKAAGEVVEVFKRNVEAVDGHCVVVESEAEAEEVVKRIVQGKKIANADESRSDLFRSDVGVTRAQAGIAETGTLVLDSSVERNRLVSLVPPVHVAILDASRIYATLSEVLGALQSTAELSPAITFITGPSRTADIELTLAIGVHGPQELYVIVIQNN